MGYWPSVRSRWLDIRPSYFFELRRIKTQIRTRPISSHLDRTSLVNNWFIISLSGKIFLRDTAGNPEQARKVHIDRLGSQLQRGNKFILPAHGANDIIDFPVMTERTRLISFLLYGLFSVILKKNTVKTPEVIFHIHLYVQGLNGYGSLRRSYTKEVSVCQLLRI